MACTVRMLLQIAKCTVDTGEHIGEYASKSVMKKNTNTWQLPPPADSARSIIWLQMTYWSRKSHLTSVQNCKLKSKSKWGLQMLIKLAVSRVQLPAACTRTCIPLEEATGISINTTGKYDFKVRSTQVKWDWPKEGFHKGVSSPDLLIWTVGRNACG